MHLSIKDISQTFHFYHQRICNNDITYCALGALSATASYRHGNYFTASCIAGQTLLLAGPLIYSQLKKSPIVSLEQKHLNVVYDHLNELSKHGQIVAKFGNFLSPNESTPYDVKEHLDKMEKGLIVSTGTERSLFDLLLADDTKCSGLVIRDISPAVKAYMDFLIMLIRISESRKEFVQFVENQQVAPIHDKLVNSTLPNELKNYYKNYLEQFSKVYFPVQHKVPELCVDYWEDDKLFAKLQKYARAGNIIATIGDIGELEFLGEEKIAVVDTSNISFYGKINLKGMGNFQPRVIETQLVSGTKYSSYQHYRPWSLSQRQENDIAYCALGALSATAFYRHSNYLTASCIAGQTLLLGVPLIYSQLKENSQRSLIANLEKKHLSLVCQDVDTKADCGFEDFLSPNEEGPYNVKIHLDKMEKGLIVSTGTERSLFDLLLADETKCSGLVIRDINPKVKAYMDFLIMLIRISESHKEFVQFVREKKVDPVHDKLKQSTLPEELKSYYMKSLEDFSKVYFPVQHLIAESDGVNYWEDNKLFAKLQKYACAGKIIATIGDIGELEFLGEEKIAVVDTSNIWDYSMIDLKGVGNFQPQVIVTKVGHTTQYFSYDHRPLSLAHKQEVNKIIEKLKEISNTSSQFAQFIPSTWFRCYVQQIVDDDTCEITAASYTRQSFANLRKAFYSNVLHIDDEGESIDIDMSTSYLTTVLNPLSTKQLQKLASIKEITRFTDRLVQIRDFRYFKPHVYMSFMNLDGWKDAFLTHMSANTDQKQELIKKVENDRNWSSFPTNFGLDDWENFKTK